MVGVSQAMSWTGSPRPSSTSICRVFWACRRSLTVGVLEQPADHDPVLAVVPHAMVTNREPSSRDTRNDFTSLLVMRLMSISSVILSRKELMTEESFRWFSIQ